ncbi:MAG: hypothetical protein HGB03_03865 [Candidatus Yonathbacteria bacterium]|nr:hypothetical protein [Candidatus Yonathbacteria bacterium]NTW47632.1 hypothetical protein [Candidatus Yonathbacteria bacterium]
MRFSFSLLPLYSGIFAIIAIAAPYGYVMAPCVLVPLVLYARNIHRTRRMAYQGGFLSGVMAGGISTFWFWGAYPLSWAGFTSPLLAGIVVGTAWIFSSLTIGIFTGIWTLFMRSPHHTLIKDVLYGASAWTLLSFVRSFAYAVLWWGKGASIGPYWDFGNLGTSFADSSFLVSITSLGGPYLFEFIIAGSAVAITHLISAYPKRHLGTMAQSVGILILFLFITPSIGHILHPHDTAESISATAISLNEPSVFGATKIDHARKQTRAKQYIDTAITSGIRTNILILPEDTGLLGSLSLDARRQILDPLAQSSSFLATDSETNRTEDGSLILTAQYIDATGTLVGQGQKRFLAPFGEYLPYIVTTFSKIFGQGHWADTFTTRRGYTHGTAIESISSKGLFSLTVLFCSETTPMSLYTEASDNGTTVFANAASHGAFTGHPLLGKYVLRKAIIHAVTHARPFIQAGNMTPSFIIDGNGHIVTSSLRGETGFISGNISLKKERTVADYAQNWILLCATILLIGNAYTIYRNTT